MHRQDTQISEKKQAKVKRQKGKLSKLDFQ